MSDNDYDGLLRGNLARVFSEADGRKREAAIAELYAPDAILYEPGHSATGHAEISAAVAALLESLPPQFAFTADGPGVGHHGVGRLRWRGVSPEGPVLVTGTDVVHVEAGRIKTLHVFLDPATA